MDSDDIYAYDPELYKMLIKYPAEMITLMDDAVKLAFADATQQNAEDVTLQVKSPASCKANEPSMVPSPAQHGPTSGSQCQHSALMPYMAGRNSTA